jgi:hypothetical protein
MPARASVVASAKPVGRRSAINTFVFVGSALMAVRGADVVQDEDRRVGE